jgi:hypothetical protein
MFTTSLLIAFVATNPTRASAFSRELLGLSLAHEDEFAVVFDPNGTALRDLA